MRLRRFKNPAKAIRTARTAPFEALDKWLLVLAAAVNLLLLFMGYYYLDIHVLAISAKKFAESGVSPYEWCERPLCSPEYRWYAYPPLPFLIVAPFYALHPGPLAERLFVKIPALLGMALLTHVLRKLGWSNRRTLAFVWLNPYFLYTATLRGNFDTLCVALMLESYLYLREGRAITAGVLGALSVLTKQYTAVILLLLLLSVRPPRKIAEYTISASLVSALVAGPFLLRSPKGFINSTLMFHLGRVPSNYGLLGLKMLGDATYILWNSAACLPKGTATHGGAHSVELLGIVLALPLALGLLKVSLDAVLGRKEAEETLGTTAALFLTLSKVVNIQYFALLSVLDIGFWEWALLAFSGAVLSLDLAKSLIPLHVAPSTLWIPPVWGLDGTWVDGLSKLIGFILYIPVLRTLLRSLRLVPFKPRGQ